MKFGNALRNTFWRGSWVVPRLVFGEQVVSLRCGASYGRPLYGLSPEYGASCFVQLGTGALLESRQSLLFPNMCC